MESRLAEAALNTRMETVDLEMQSLSRSAEAGTAVEHAGPTSVVQRVRTFVEFIAVVFLSPWRFLLNLF